MSGLPLFMSYMLLVHNIVDFSEYGACEPYLQRLNCLVTDYVEMLERCNDLRLVNKTGHMGKKICNIGLQFESEDHHDINSGRKFMVALIDNFVKTMNQDPRLNPYLECPFTADNIELRLHFVDNCLYSYPTSGRILYMSFMEGAITYDVGNPRNPGELEKLREESLEFARRASEQY
jgi:hypothetical protein